MAYVQWIPEKEAADKLRLKPRTLRRLVKSGRWRVDFTAPNGRGYQYSEKGIEKILLEFSSVTTKV